MRFTSPHHLTRGFTLIEMLVSVAIFTIVMLISVSAFLSILDANQKTRSTKLVLNNVNASLESMARAVRDGSNYHCGSGGSITQQQECPSGSNFFAFEGRDGNPDPSTGGGDQIAFRLQTDPVTGFGRIERTLDSGSSWLPVTAANVDISKLEFVYEAISTDQPRVLITLQGVAGADDPKTRSEFELQTTVSERFAFDTTLSYQATENVCNNNGICEWGESALTCPAAASACQSTMTSTSPGAASTNGICEWGEGPSHPDCAGTAGSPGSSGTPGTCTVTSTGPTTGGSVICPFLATHIGDFETGRTDKNTLSGWSSATARRTYTSNSDGSSLNIPAGTYNVYLAGYDWHSSTTMAHKTQPQEQFRVIINHDGGSPITTGLSSDIPDSQDVGYGKVASNITIGNVTSIVAQYWHWPVAVEDSCGGTIAGPGTGSKYCQSMVPACIGFVETTPGSTFCTSGTSGSPGSSGTPPTNCTTCSASNPPGSGGCDSSCVEPGSVTTSTTVDNDCTGCLASGGAIGAACSSICVQPAPITKNTTGDEASVEEF